MADDDPGTPGEMTARRISDLIPDVETDVTFEARAYFVTDDGVVRKISQVGEAFGFTGTPMKRSIRIVAGPWEVA